MTTETRSMIARADAYTWAGLLLLLTAVFFSPVTAAKTGPMVRLPGHVLPALERATLLKPSPGSDKANEPIALTVVLKRDDQAGFERYLHDVYDPKSPLFHRYLKQSEIAAKFGPSRKAYDEVLGYLRKHRLELVEGSANRLTLTVRGTRAEVQRALGLQIADYRLGKTRFFANKRDPELPLHIASSVQAVIGLSDLARPHAADFPDLIGGLRGVFAKVFAAICKLGVGADQKLKNDCTDFAKWAFQYNGPDTIDPPRLGSKQRDGADRWYYSFRHLPDERCSRLSRTNWRARDKNCGCE